MVAMLRIYRGVMFQLDALVHSSYPDDDCRQHVQLQIILRHISIQWPSM